MTELRAEYVSEDVRRLNPDVFESDTQLRNAGAGPVSTGSDLEERFAEMWAEHSTYRLEHDKVKPHPFRRWRLDFAHVPSKVGIEIHGATWQQGRHNRGDGFANDRRKMNECLLHGWHVFELTAEMLTPAWIETINDHIMERMEATE